MKNIILIHGLFLHPLYMGKMKTYFQSIGYRVHTFGYKSTQYSPQTLKELRSLVDEIRKNSNEIYFIGHSMGGIIARRLFQEYQLNLDDTAIVTIGSPHYTSELGIFLRNSFLGYIFGSAGDSGIMSPLEKWNNSAPLGCIAGISKYGPSKVFLYKNKQSSDGTVFLSEAILKEATDSVVITCQHTAMIYSREVMVLCDNFIKNKNFKLSS